MHAERVERPAQQPRALELRLHVRDDAAAVDEPGVDELAGRGAVAAAARAGSQSAATHTHARCAAAR